MRYSWVRDTGMVAVLSAVLAVGAGCPPRTTVGGESVTSSRLDVQDFSGAAEEVTNQMLMAPRVQEELRRISATLPAGQRPLIKISRIRDDTGLRNVNMVDNFVSPIESVLINSGKADSFSEDRTAQETAAGHDILHGTQPRLADLVLYGVVSKLRTADDRVSQNAYTFRIRLSSASSGTDFFIGTSKPVIKQTRH